MYEDHKAKHGNLIDGASFAHTVPRWAYAINRAEIVRFTNNYYYEYHSFYKVKYNTLVLYVLLL